MAEFEWNSLDYILINNNLGARKRRQSLFDIVSCQIGRAFQRRESELSLSPTHNSPNYLSKDAMNEDVLRPLTAGENEPQIVPSSCSSISPTSAGDTCKNTSRNELPIHETQSTQTPQPRTWRVGSFCFGGEFFTTTTTKN